LLPCRFIFQCDIIQGTPPALRKKAARLVGAKTTLLARMDAYGQVGGQHCRRGQMLQGMDLLKLYGKILKPAVL